MNRELIIPYNEARKLIKEADVLLFRNPPFPSIGWVIARYTGGMHSHVGLATWNRNRLKCVEFREFRGGRSVMLSTQVAENPNRIDVFRPLSELKVPVMLGSQSCEQAKTFTHEVARAITGELEELTGLPYGWSIIGQIVKSYLPGFRLAKGNFKDDDNPEIYVCSTAVSYTFRKHYVDPTPYLSDISTKPADLARSPLFQYMFTIGEI